MELIPSHHPLTPPHTVEERVHWLCLLRSRRVGTATFYRLMREYGDAQSALKALPEIARGAGVPRYLPCPESTARAEMKRGEKLGARLICIGDPEYPALLGATEAAPPMIWAKGNLSLLSRDTLSIVGARNASSMGTRFARQLAQELGSEGYVIASGFARGIDTAAHEAAIESGTIAVMAGGIDQIYPAENKTLYAQIARSGLMISEQPIGMRPIARHFPQRNRIIAALSRATLVIEAAHRSGSLITAQDALKAGREVMAVPGHPFDGRAGGCNQLLRDGATLMRHTQDVLDHLQNLSPLTVTQPPQEAPKPQASTRTEPKNTRALHQELLAKISQCPLDEDTLLRDIREPRHHISRAIQELEITGKIARSEGGKVVLSSA